MEERRCRTFIAPADKDSYAVTFGMKVFGRDEYHCHFTGVFKLTDRGLAAAVAHNTDPEVDDDVVSSLLIARDGHTLSLWKKLPMTATSAASARACRALPVHCSAPASTPAKPIG